MNYIDLSSIIFSTEKVNPKMIRALKGAYTDDTIFMTTNDWFHSDHVEVHKAYFDPGVRALSIHDMLHNPCGPALIIRDKHTGEITEHFYLNGNRMSLREFILQTPASGKDLALVKLKYGDGLAK